MMVGPTSNGRIRPAFSVTNGGSDHPPGSNGGSDCGGIEFTREDVEALLNEKIKVKNKFSFKERCDQMMDYIKKLRICIKWFQEIEGSYLLQLDNLRNMLEGAESKCIEMEVLIENKEEELNAIIGELKKNFLASQEKFAKEEADKLDAMSSLTKEKEARYAAEKSKDSLSEELIRAQREHHNATQKISSLNEMYKRLQEYNTSLQEYNSNLQTDLATVNEALKRVEKEKAAAVNNLSTLRSQNSVLLDQLTSSRALQADAIKQKEDLVNEFGSVKEELQQVREDRDHHLANLEALSEEVLKYKECTGRSSAELDSLIVKSDELELRCLSQSEQIKTLQEKLAIAENKSQMSDLSALETKMEYERQKKVIYDFEERLADAEFKIVDGEALRKKLHNTILELKGNIRVFCRVRPLLPDETAVAETKLISYPTSTEALGRGIDMSQNGQQHSFTFDKVFMPDASQDEVFVEISQLVQSALDGYKVCIFAYGQTGSGKTYTMMGRPGFQEQKGLIPRSLEQIFQSRQALQSQGWKYEMQVSMLEIYNETIRDLLSVNRSGSDAARTENGVLGKQYAIKHDSNGNTHVSDLTIVDVDSTKEVAYLLNHAAQSRSVGKTQMNEQSSRSHFVFTLRISGTNESTEQNVQGVLNLIDLAGSERLSKSGSSGDRLKETQAINKSLSALSDVIFALAKKDDHVPFRNSKLTYLLQPCLGGDSKTLMFVNISPDHSSLGESLCSLRFASRVNACEIGTPRRQTNPRPSEYRLSYG